MRKGWRRNVCQPFVDCRGVDSPMLMCVFVLDGHGSYLVEISLQTRLAIGTAERPVAPMSGLIFFLLKRFVIFTMQMPDAIERPNAKKPPTTIPMVVQLRNACTVIVAPTQRPRKTVAVFMMELEMVSNRRPVSEPISFRRLPNMSIPMSDTADGTSNATMVVTAIGKIACPVPSC